ncbi:Leucine-rich repeat-containing protein 26 [Formica fusca]
MQAAPLLLSLLLILLHHSGWTHGLCKLENSTVAWCDVLEDLGQIETYHLETLTAPTAQDTLIPDLFDNLTSLRHLDMSSGNLKTIEPGSFRALSNLRSLDLSNNHIEYLELASLEGLTDLRKLNLRKNAIRQLPPALARLKHLRHLDINDNPLDCNCATLKVRDLIVQRKVSVSKKVVCADPSNLKGTSLMKPNAAIVCSFEQQDREMQNDQAVEGSGTYSGSGDDILNEFNSEEEENEHSVGINGNSSEKPEVETPSPIETMSSSTGSSVIEPTISSQESITVVEETTSVTTNSLQSTVEDEDIFFDSEERKEPMSTTEMSRKKEDFKDALFYPSEGSGDGDEDGSGEGSGIIWSRFGEEKTEKDSANEESSSSLAGTLWDILFGSSATTAIPSETKDLDLEQEEFINASSTKLATEESIASSKNSPTESDIDKFSTETTAITNNVEVLKSTDKSKSGNVKAEVNSLNDEQAEVSPAKQSKKGMGSYIVLAILLLVVAVLIGFAAYRGDICRKKRKRGDVENGTELRDMQKSLLPDTGNLTQPKIASNGNPENIPLVEGTSDGDDAKIDKIQNDHHPIQETPRSLNGTADHMDPVKPPRKLINSQDDQKSEDRPRVDVNSLRENFLAGRTSPAQPSDSSLATNNGPKAHISEANGPPLSPGAQRVKITLQENPDSVPKTPILITRTMAGENLVKTP